MKQATERQLRVLRYVEAFQRAHGYAPTIREIGKAIGIKSSNGVNDHLLALTRKGYIRRDQEKSRSIVVLRSADGAPKIDGGGPDLLGDMRMTYGLGVENAERAVMDCTKRRAIFGGEMLQVVDLDEALRKIRALVAKEGDR